MVSPVQDSMLETDDGMLAVSVSDHGAVRKLSLNVPSSPVRQVTAEESSPGRNVMAPQAAAAMPTRPSFTVVRHCGLRMYSPTISAPTVTPAINAAWT
ncbi:hypothetical protein ACQGFI_30955 [Rhodococcus sp. 2.95]